MDYYDYLVVFNVWWKSMKNLLEVLNDSLLTNSDTIYQFCIDCIDYLRTSWFIVSLKSLRNVLEEIYDNI